MNRQDPLGMTFKLVRQYGSHLVSKVCAKIWRQLTMVVESLPIVYRHVQIHTHAHSHRHTQTHRKNMRKDQGDRLRTDKSH